MTATLEATEARIRHAMTEARGRGYHFVQGHWLWRKGMACCAVGALDLAFDDSGTIGDVWFEHGAHVLQIATGKVAAIVSGFDGRRWDGLHAQREWHELGARLWEFVKAQGWTEPPEVVQ